ncbi:heterokaryon incompatibility protein-domain-containing protein [Cercophora newfieldiana]|uniref:Heterokaryon incompatibility protein-domain-containing protein n=1 Tax=Cercophora newfieldiana TaxID=92897 RepID=A0AA40CMA8_9PEZI|nr:heterokaryon incompatibility protein-domain-containing protein [Cercophora newfieldiana]
MDAFQMSNASSAASDSWLAHQPLDRSAKSIRLLRFRDPPAALGHYDFDLTPHVLSDAPPFICLSYTWGDPNGPQKQIWINGLRFFVRENLFAALRMLHERTADTAPSNRKWFTDRHPEYKPYRDGWWDGRLSAENFWIDAICINQDDPLERGHQVGMMRDIFSAANLVLAWLGDNADSGQPLAAFHAVVHGLEDIAIAPSAERQAEGILQLRDLPYWGRMWIKQEFILPRRLVIVWGQYGIWWGALAKFLNVKRLPRYELLAQHQWHQKHKIFDHVLFTKPRTDMTEVQMLCSHKHLRYGPTTSGSSRTLDSLLMSFHRGKCLDPRDKVYALLGLVGMNHDSQQLLPDYTISTTQLYYRTLCYIRHSPNLADKASWDSIRATLREALGIPSDKTLNLTEIVYKLSEPDRPLGQPLSHFFPESRLALTEKTLATLREDFGDTDCFKLFGVEDPRKTYDLLVDRLNFPRQEDPEGWQCFDDILREALGVPRLLEVDKEMFESFIDYPEEHESDV